MDSSGNLYGTTVGSGPYGYDSDYGMVFELAHGASGITPLAWFNGPNGAGPDAGLIMDSSGKLYGTAYYGGTSNGAAGTVFELAHGSGTLSALASFSSYGTNGAYPAAALIMDSSGNLYGTAYYGGAAGAGTVFELPRTFADPNFQISGFPSSASAGATQTFTFTADNAYGTINTGYTGTVHFTSTDPQAILPADFAFMPAEAGVHTFTAKLKTAGTQSITATDTANNVLAGSTTTSVTAAAASVLVITGPSAATAGVAFSITVTAYDAYGNVASGYAGTLQFTSSDMTANLPANYTFNAADKGTHTFSGLVLNQKGTQSITATDTLSSSIIGTLSVSVA